MRTISQIVTVIAVTAIFAAQAGAQDSPEVGNNPQPNAQEATVTVLSIAGGRSQYRTGPDAKWATITSETKLGVGGEVRTGLTSKLKLRVGPNMAVEISGVSTLAIADLAVDAEAIRTTLAQKYGNVDIDVQHVGNLRNDTTIATPTDVLAVKGTKFKHVCFGSFSQTRGNSGTVNVNGKHGVGKGDVSSNHQHDPNKNAEQSNNQNNTSTPDADGDNASGNNSTQGFQGQGAGEVKSQGDQYDAWHSSIDNFQNMIPHDDPH